MKAKEYLKQFEKLDCLITNKMIEASQWRAMATNTTVPMGGERVQTSGSKQKMADAVTIYADIEAEILEDVKVLRQKQKDVLSIIEQLNATEYDVLHKAYMRHMSLYEIATSYKKTYSWVTTIHGRALKNVQRILNERELRWQENG